MCVCGALQWTGVVSRVCSHLTFTVSRIGSRSMLFIEMFSHLKFLRNLIKQYIKTRIERGSGSVELMFFF